MGFDVPGRVFDHSHDAEEPDLERRDLARIIH
jgi:hypothetical protein